VRCWSGARKGWRDTDVRELARGIRCPTLVIHRRLRQARVLPQRQEIHDLVPGSQLLTSGGWGGICRLFVTRLIFNRSVRDFVAGPPRTCAWVRAMSRRRKALFISSPIGLGTCSADLAIGRELRKLHPDLDIDWFTVDPAARYLAEEGERVHPITGRLAR